MSTLRRRRCVRQLGQRCVSRGCCRPGIGSVNDAFRRGCWFIHGCRDLWLVALPGAGRRRGGNIRSGGDVRRFTAQAGVGGARRFNGRQRYDVVQRRGRGLIAARHGLARRDGQRRHLPRGGRRRAGRHLGGVRRRWRGFGTGVNGCGDAAGVSSGRWRGLGYCRVRARWFRSRVARCTNVIGSGSHGPGAGDRAEHGGALDGVAVWPVHVRGRVRRSCRQALLRLGRGGRLAPGLVAAGRRRRATVRRRGALCLRQQLADAPGGLGVRRRRRSPRQVHRRRISWLQRFLRRRQNLRRHAACASRSTREQRCRGLARSGALCAPWKVHGYRHSAKTGSCASRRSRR